MHFACWLAHNLQYTLGLSFNRFNNFKTKASPHVKQENGPCHSKFHVTILING